MIAILGLDELLEKSRIITECVGLWLWAVCAIRHGLIVGQASPVRRGHDGEVSILILGTYIGKSH